MAMADTEPNAALRTGPGTTEEVRKRTVIPNGSAALNLNTETTRLGLVNTGLNMKSRLGPRVPAADQTIATGDLTYMRTTTAARI